MGRKAGVRATIATFAALAIALALPRTVRPQSVSPSVVLAISKTTFLSTESATGRVTIANTTNRELGYLPLANRVFESVDGGPVHEEQRIGIVTRLVPPQWLSPGERRTIEVGLPSCEVTSDPCSVAASVTLSFVARDRTVSTATTGTVAYRFVADPKATYHGDGVRDDLPLFFADGSATQDVPRDVLTITFHLAGTLDRSDRPPPDYDRISTIFWNAGVAPGPRSFGAEPGGFAVAISLPRGLLDAKTEAAIAAVRASLGKRMREVTTQFGADDRGPDRAISGSLDAARRTAARVAAFFGIDSVATTQGSGVGVALRMRVAGERPSDFVAYDPFTPFSKTLGSEALGSSPYPCVVDVEFAATAAFVGDSVAQVPARPFPETATAYVGTNDARWFESPLHATIAADRPEIVAYGDTTLERSDRLGVEAAPLAASVAMEADRALAHDLGVVAGPLTLVDLFPHVTWDAATSIVPVAVAIAPSGDLDGSWRGFATSASRQPTPSPDEMPRAMPTPYPQPTPTPPPASAGRPEASRALVVAPGAPETLSYSNADVVDVGRPLGATLDVRFSGDGAQTQVSRPTIDEVASALAGLPSVARPLAADDGYGAMGFAVDLATTDPARLAAVARRLGDLARHHRSIVSIATFATNDDCLGAIGRARRRSLEAAIRSAVADATARGRSLRHLLLVIAEPASVDRNTVCRDTIAAPIFQSSDGKIDLDLPATIVAHAPIALTFRLAGAP